MLAADPHPRPRSTARTEAYIRGAWVPLPGAPVLPVFDSCDGRPMGGAPAAGQREVDGALHAASAALPAWAATSVTERAEACAAIAAGLAARGGELADLLTRETGMPRWLSELVQVGLPMGSFSTAARLGPTFPFQRWVDGALVVEQPVGVVAAITPWNYPLHQLAAKVAWALVAGSTVVAKPSEVAPLSAYVLAEVIDQVDLPPGVFNLVPGTGPEVGEALASHPLVDMVSFTGSGRAGQRVAELAARGPRRVALELGGKSANVLLDLDDATFERAVREAVGACFLNSGQSCNALSRLLVPRHRLRVAEEVLADEVERSHRPADPFAEGAQLGPLACAAQVERVLGHIRGGIDAGARLVVGGLERPPGVHPEGYFVAPTVFSEVDPGMAIARDEVFGPVLSVLTFVDEDDAVRQANDSDLGLAGGVWAADLDHAIAVAQRIRTGQVVVNGGAFNPNAPFGGVKGSGYGREHGLDGMREMLVPQALHLP